MLRRTRRCPMGIDLLIGASLLSVLALSLADD
jgi:hypothetical protein